MFHCSNCNVVHFSTMLKNNLKSHTSLLTLMMSQITSFKHAFNLKNREPFVSINTKIK
jgi:hypothetical protein